MQAAFINEPSVWWPPCCGTSSQDQTYLFPRIQWPAAQAPICSACASPPTARCAVLRPPAWISVARSIQRAYGQAGSEIRFSQMELFLNFREQFFKLGYSSIYGNNGFSFP